MQPAIPVPQLLSEPVVATASSSRISNQFEERDVKGIVQRKGSMDGGGAEDATSPIGGVHSDRSSPLPAGASTSSVPILPLGGDSNPATHSPRPIVYRPGSNRPAQTEEEQKAAKARRRAAMAAALSKDTDIQMSEPAGSSTPQFKTPSLSHAHSLPLTPASTAAPMARSVSSSGVGEKRSFEMMESGNAVASGSGSGEISGGQGSRAIPRTSASFSMDMIAGKPAPWAANANT